MSTNRSSTPASAPTLASDSNTNTAATAVAHSLHSTSTSASASASSCVISSIPSDVDSSIISRPSSIPPSPPVPAHVPHALAAMGAGVIASVFTSPFDVIRTRLAVQEDQRIYKGLFGSCRVILQKEGVKGLYRGFGPTIINVPAFWAIYFSAYHDVKTRFDHHPDTQSWPMWSKNLLAACSAGVIGNVIVNPLFVARTRMQTQHMLVAAGNINYHHGPMYTGTWNTLTRLVREEGPLSLMRGVSASLLGVSHCMIQFPAYEYLKVALPAISKARSLGHDEMTAVHEAMEIASNAARTGEGLSNDPAVEHLILASALSKLIASVVTYPHETLRSRLQNAPVSRFTGLWDCAKKTVKQEGFYAMYKGLGVNLVRTVSGCVITFVSYELLLKELKKYFGST